MRRRRQRASELLVHDDAVEQRHLAAAVLLGQQHAEEAELAELRPERVGVAERVVLHRAHDVEPAVARADTGDGVAQHLLLG